jgi:hypothetical protein
MPTSRLIRPLVTRSLFRAGRKQRHGNVGVSRPAHGLIRHRCTGTRPAATVFCTAQRSPLDVIDISLRCHWVCKTLNEPPRLENRTLDGKVQCPDWGHRQGSTRDASLLGDRPSVRAADADDHPSTSTSTSRNNSP